MKGIVLTNNVFVYRSVYVCICVEMFDGIKYCMNSCG